MDKPQTIHRPGAFKQPNKYHKHGGHRSKRQIYNANKGKVSSKQLGVIMSKKKRGELNKEERRHQALQIRKNKRDEVLNKKRALGGLGCAPLLVCIVPLNRQTDYYSVVDRLMKCDSEAIVNKSPSGAIHVYIPRFKQKLSFITPQIDNELGVLDALKVADSVLFVTKAEINENDVIDQWGQNILMSSFAQGLPTPLIAISDLEGFTQKKRHKEHKQAIQKHLDKWFPEEKLMSLDSCSDGINILRKLGNQKQRSVSYRDRRPHLHAENVEFVPHETGPYGFLKVTGYLRGATLSVNSLIHLPGIGDFQMSQIDAPNDPYDVDRNNRNKNASMECNESDIRVLDRADPSKQESLDAENIPDSIEPEQTVPTNEELELAEKESKTKKMKRVPEGWSDYQSAWIPDDDAEFQDDADDSDEELVDEAMSQDSEETHEEFDAVTESEVPINDEKYDQEMDFMAERQALEKIRAAKDDKEFPDEVDTPIDQPARIRFKKYQPMPEGFKKSPWDAKVNLPGDYQRIFHFKNFNHVKKRILNEQADVDGAQPGWYITVHIKNVSKLLWSNFEKLKTPLILFGLLPFEHKMSLVNIFLKRTPNDSTPIKSKERLIFQCGYRRFAANPIFSEHTIGDKHKFERFFQPESNTVATFYGRMQFPPSPVLCYKEVEGKLILVATGGLVSCDPNRVILKRVLLTGHPFKIDKKSAIIRFMFFDREDIIHYKRYALRAKYGRKGHIKEPLGTHGHMKCKFNGQLKSNDTVTLELYKRVFPKWSYEDLIVTVADEEMET